MIQLWLRKSPRPIDNGECHKLQRKSSLIVCANYVLALCSPSTFSSLSSLCLAFASRVIW
ncbi:Protein of unknown function [Pyronema omphalodes CBS 100304]|uniref:Uncharacterized protein n=1 Tax=Pyronema omphalodes (strain CBS 100304) TaxID=1076935 RepID=U4LTT0_PYROM|nr:Protein of unknown function [Pyronema omphalodes CBS 100304]